MATAYISAATLAFLGVITLILWGLVYWRSHREVHPMAYSRQRIWHRYLLVCGLLLVGLSVASAYFGLR